MRTSILVTIAILFNGYNLFAQQYAVFLIPQQIINANAVIRNSEMSVGINNEGSAFIRHTYAITILNRNADEYAALEEHYNKLINIKSISGTLYDASGKRIKKTGKSDIQDVSATSSGSLAEENRLKTHNFNWNSYPYTIEYEIETEIKSLFFLPNWIPVIDENVSVENSVLNVAMPADYHLRYKMFNTNDPIAYQEKNEKILTWKIENYAAIKSEPYSTMWHKNSPSVMLAPEKFQLQKYSGSMADWKSLGNFMRTLNAGRDELPQDVKKTVHDLTDQLSSSKEKIEKLYDYLQHNTRYISVQLGIGGWQTFDAKYVAENKYGDCKALSNYMISLLKEANIKAYPALIHAGTGKVNFEDDFASNQFNHMIVCIPGRDTTWLECTSQTISCGYLGDFTSNRPALLITENGGELVSTPKYNYQQNLQKRVIKGTMDAEGNLQMKIITEYHAEQQDQIHSLVNEASKTVIQDHLTNELSVPSFDLLKWNYTNEKNQFPVIKEELELIAYNYASLTGKRIFITPNILNRSKQVLSDTVKRKTPLFLKYEYTDIDSVELKIPGNYLTESNIRDVYFSTKFGNYSRRIKVDKDNILYIRKLEKFSGEFPAEDATAFANFLSDIRKADALRIVLVKNQ